MDWDLWKRSLKYNWYNYDNNKQKTLKLSKAEFLCDPDQLLQIQHEELKVWCLANNLRKK